MGFKCGIVGLPNVGKSTLFNALTNAEIQAENYPFCTIEPNLGLVNVPDPRLDALADIVKPEKVIPTAIEFVDIAGLVAGAAKGEGLGNQFLANIREADAILHVVRCFEDENVVHVDGRVDPASDIETITTELLLKDLETIEKNHQRASKVAKSGDKKARFEQALYERVKQHMDEGLPARSLNLTSEEAALLKTLQLLTMKPTLYVANVSEEGFDNNPHLDTLQAIAGSEDAPVVVISAAIEAELISLDKAERDEYLSELGLTEPGLNKMVRAGYELLDLITYFTAGPKEVRAWTVKQHSTAPQAAGVIHTDFEKGFIRAEVISFNDFVEHKGEQGAKDAGKWRLEGKDYIVVDGDVMHFRFNV